MLRLTRVFKYSHLGKAYFSVSAPTYMVFFVTARCNARCDHCFYWEKIDNSNNISELSLSEIERIANNLQGMVQVSLTGGEPFLRSDFAEIIKVFYRYSGTRFFNISTNGSLPTAMEKVLRDALASTPEAFYRITISMDDVGEAHDRRRKIANLAGKVKETVDMLNQLQQIYPQMAITLGTIIDAHNQASLPQIYDYVKRNFHIDDWEVGIIRGKPRNMLLKDIDPSYNDAILNTIKNSFISSSWIIRQSRKLLVYEGALKTKIIKEKRQVIPCLAGKKMVVLREDGKVEPCEMLDYFLGKDSVMGNIRDFGYKLKELIQDKKSQDIRQFIATGKCYCTYECALHCSIFYNPIELIKVFLKNPVISNAIQNFEEKKICQNISK